MLAVAGCVTLFGSWIYDAHQAGRIVERRNRARDVVVVPSMLPTPGGDPVPGAMLAGAF